MRSTEARRAAGLARRTDNDELRLQARWPARVQLRVPEIEKTYSGLPYAFVDAHPPVADDALRALSLACKLLRSAELLRVAPPPAAMRLATPAVRAVAAQTEALAALAACVGDAPGVWDALRDAEARLAHALSAEELHRAGRRTIESLDDADARGYAAARGVAIRVAVAGVAALSGYDGAREALLLSVDRYCEARQLAADLLGWKRDLVAGRPSIVLARLARAAPQEYARAVHSGETRALARELFAAGVARDVLQWIADDCDDALRAIGAVAGCDRWAATIGVTAQRATALRAEFSPRVSA